MKTFHNSRRSKKSLPDNADEELALYQKLIDQIGDQVFAVDKDGKIVFLNQATARLLGVQSSSIIGKSITRFLDRKVSRDEWRRRYFNKAKRAGKPVQWTIDLKTGRQHERKTLELNVSITTYRQIQYLLCVGRNVTERIELEDKLKESESMYRQLFDAAGDSIFITDLNGVIISANKNAENLVKIKPKDYVGKHFEMFLYKDSMDIGWESFRNTIKNGEVIRGELNIVNKMGDAVPVEFTASPIFKNGKVKYVHSIVRDIRKRREVEALKSQSEKMHTIHNFISGTAHELQSPLQGVLKHSEYLIEKYKERNFEYIGYKEFKNILETLEKMRDQVRYCVGTADRLLGIQRRRLGISRDSCDANQLIRQITKAIQHELQAAGIRLKVHTSSRLPLVAIGRPELQQVVTNVINNAVQSMPAGGQLMIRTSVIKDDNKIRLDFKDDGVGIPSEALPRVFEPFFTTKTRGLEKSSGLGLTIVYSIIKSIQGDIQIRSTLREGTTISVILPAAKDKPS